MNRSKVFKNAHRMMKLSNYNLDWGYCLKVAYKAEKQRMLLRQQIIQKLKSGQTSFEFIKTDGKTVRLAVGTLKFDQPYIRKGPKRKTNVEVVKYFDVEKGSFRSFKLDNFRGFKAA